MFEIYCSFNSFSLQNADSFNGHCSSNFSIVLRATRRPNCVPNKNNKKWLDWQLHLRSNLHVYCATIIVNFIKQKKYIISSHNSLTLNILFLKFNSYFLRDINCMKQSMLIHYFWSWDLALNSNIPSSKTFKALFLFLLTCQSFLFSCQLYQHT